MKTIFCLLLVGSLSIACAPASGTPTDPAEGHGAVGEGVSGDLPTGTLLRATGYVNLRKSPSKSAKILEVVPKGALASVVQGVAQNGFYGINHAGTFGWSSAKYYELAEPAPNPGGGNGQIWSPPLGTSWQWQLSGSIDTSVDVQMYDVDLFETPASTISALHAKGRTVICYFSAGSREDWRPDAGDFVASDYGKGLDGWAGETWLDTRSANVRAIMSKRLDLALSKGCDGVEPDNVDGYANDTGFALTASTQRDYDQFLAQSSHARSLSVGLKNTVDLAADLVDAFDWALNEECFAYSECSALAPFVSANKAVFHVEYASSQAAGAAKKAAVCGKPSVAGFSTLIKTLDLGAWRLSCD